MKLIIDTHIFLWALSEPEKIPASKLAQIETRANLAYVSSVSTAEIMIKASIGKLDVDFDPVEMVRRSGFEMLSFDAEDALPLKDLPFHHRDPFDRMLIAQSLRRKIPIVTDDAKFQAYDCKVV